MIDFQITTDNLCLSLGLDHRDDRRTQLQCSSHATGLFPAASVVWHIKIHGRESGNDLSTLGIMELLSLNLMQSVSPLQPCTFQSWISVLSCRPSMTIARASIGNCCATHGQTMENPALTVSRAPAMARIDRRLHELGRKIGSPSPQVKPLR